MAQDCLTGYRGVRRLQRRLARPYTARLGKNAADFLGYFETAEAAAVAYAEAVLSRAESASQVSDAISDLQDEDLEGLLCPDPAVPEQEGLSRVLY